MRSFGTDGLHPATGDETDSCHISAQLDGVFIITTQQEIDRGRDDRVVGAMEGVRN